MDSTSPSRSVVHGALRLFAKSSCKNGRVHGVILGMLIFTRTLNRCQTFKFLHALTFIPSQLTQSITRHCNLNKYHNEIGKSRSEYCPKCERDGGRRQYETIGHVLFVCPYYDDLRKRLHCDAHLPAWPSTIREFFHDKDMLKTLIQFTKNCGRI